MNRLLSGPALLLLATLGGCGSGTQAPDKNLLAANDYEELAGWVDATALPSLTSDKAHSGKYSSMVKPDIEYGIGYSAPLSQLTATRITRMTVSAWVLMTEIGTPATIVTELRDAGVEEPLYWEALDLSQQVTAANEWQRVEKTISVPAAASGDTQFKVYPWRNGSQQPAYFDDLKIVIAE